MDAKFIVFSLSQRPTKPDVHQAELTSVRPNQRKLIESYLIEAIKTKTRTPKDSFFFELSDFDVNCKICYI